MAKLISVSVRTLDRWIESRKVSYIKVGNTIRFVPDDVFEDIKRFEVTAVTV